MKILTTLLLVFLLSANTCAQEFSGGPYFESNQFFRYIAGTFGDQTIAVVSDKRFNQYVQIIGNDLKVVEDYPIAITVNNKTITEAISVKLYGSTAHLLLQDPKPKKKTKRLYHARMDLKSGKIIDVKEILINEKCPKGFPGFYKIFYSETKNTMLVYYNILTKKRDPKVIGLAVFDCKNMTKLWTRELELPYETQDFSMGTRYITDDGVVCFTATTYPSIEIEKNKKERLSQAKLKMFLLNGEDNKLKSLEFSFSKKFHGKLIIKEGNDGNVICGALYNSPNQEGVKGYYYAQVNSATGTLIKEKTTPFSDEFILSTKTKYEAEELKKNVQKKGGELYLKYYALLKLVVQDDGVIFVSEQNYTSTTLGRKPDGKTKITTYYNSRDIILVKINERGREMWSNYIPKYQYALSSTHHGFMMYEGKDGLHFLYNGNSKNLEKDKSNKMTKTNVYYRNHGIIHAFVNEKGEVTRTHLNAQNLKVIYLQPSEYEPIGDDKLFIFLQERRTLNQYGIFTF